MPVAAASMFLELRSRPEELHGWAPGQTAAGGADSRGDNALIPLKTLEKRSNVRLGNCM
jgi:hypothetical protein